MARLTTDELLRIFLTLKNELKLYEKGAVKARFDMEGKYELVSEKEGIMALGKPRKEMDFSALIVQSGYVGFYFMPIYCSAAIRLQLSPNLLKLLKGKSCFHIKAVDDALLTDIRHALKVGFEGYKKLSWV
ncbi:MAG: hypothetical protein P4L41_15160 [Flavipsychrobacter sp.]|nr:hypothetical protein [Flavipsychrobacter sp.]